ncbi:hypothetical protein [Xanthovirga aplysinae]|uniref:hypothetical protein n=1 Tax=Xanthovirga aplysinae TaxID=2529853 RepID=UPI001CA457F7|nr:hypothetical protein [Xanthovirga aplysinae]MTI30636.1 hypothetical protein [Xanthovirga aplysinae]
MQKVMNFNIGQKGPVSQQFVELGILDFQTAKNWTRNLPYGRNSDRSNPFLIFSELKGSCSTKHALLRMLAKEQNQDQIKLIIGIYKMNALNTPGIGDILFQNQLDYIPEAHCYLSINGERTDITFTQGSFKELEKDILEEIEIQAHEIGDFKVNYHRDFLNIWLPNSKVTHLTFKQIWQIRENCIKKLAEING